jgi:site-specific DNA-methyltransferase (adenine-specific)/site-specific DNA-methyltransferase (cytosine-N4-specific)
VPADVARVLAGAPINVAITSPPYADRRKYDEESGFRPVPPEKYVEWFEAVQVNVAAHLAQDGSFFLNIKEHCEDGQRVLYVKDLVLAHVRIWGWRFVDEFCWYKTAMPGFWPNRFRNEWEPVFQFSRRADIKFRPAAVSHESDDVPGPRARTSTTFGGNHGFDASSRDRKSGAAWPGNVLKLSTRLNPDGNDHSAAFPVDLPEFFARAFSDEGDIIFEPFMGSGSTLIAAERTKRRARGCEISPAYCDVAVTRWEAFTGRKATREPAARPSPPRGKPRRK